MLSIHFNLISIAVLSLALFVSFNIFVKNSVDVTMANCGLLFVSNATKVQNIFLSASKYIKNVLYIKVNGSSEGSLSILSKQITNIYSEAPYHCSNLDVRLMLKLNESIKSIETNFPVDLIMYDSALHNEAHRLKKLVVNVKNECKLQSIDSQDIKSSQNEKLEPVKLYNYVALGGTFDRLHNGHKILLSQAVLRTSRHLTVGVTDVNMIQSKKLWELIEPVEQRIKAVLNFLKDINPDLEYNVVPIQDIYGPTKDDPRFQLLVVSEETARGGAKVNEKRKENGLSPLDSYVIGLAEDNHPGRSDEEEAKISSSNQRMRLLGTLLKPPVPNRNIPDWPYVIGLAGGIASGKSSITEKLKAKGAGVVNCDLIAHDLYKPGLPLNSTIAESFGKQIITDSGEVDRKKLGQIVFGDKSQLEKLNQLVWPAVIEEAKRRVKALGEQGYRVVVMEAAVMVRANWYTHCHQLWSVIIPPEEAIKRLQKRNNLTEEEARQRVAAQPSNLEQVLPANIVFSPYWSYEYTQGQLDRAWEHLQAYLNKRQNVTSVL